MAKHNETGAYGEMLAQQWLINQGYTLLETNWRVGRLEIDIICCKHKKVHMVEVKCRKGTRFGYPETRVNRKKLKNMIAAGSAYILQKRIKGWISYDILAITLFPCKEPEYLFIEDVY